MDLKIDDKCALVLAGGGGLGAAVAAALAAEGARVVVADRSATRAEEAAAAARHTGGTAEPLTWDIGDITVVADRLGAVHELYGTVDILVNITGGPDPCAASDVTPEAWHQYFTPMVAGVTEITRLALPAMKARHWGRVITSTSSGVIAPIPNLAISNALRMSLVGWSKTLAREIGRDGVTANVVVPGRIGTDRVAQLDRARADREQRPVAEVAASSIETIPLGRYGDPSEYGQVVAFLASESASYITGSVLRVDGGLIGSI